MTVFAEAMSDGSSLPPWEQSLFAIPDIQGTGQHPKNLLYLSWSSEHDSDWQYAPIVEELLQTDEPKVLECLDVINSIYGWSQSSGLAFPEELKDSVGKGAQQLVADSLYAVRYHYNHGQETKVALPLNDQPDVLPLNLTGDEPLELLRKLEAAFKLLVKAGRINRLDRYYLDEHDRPGKVSNTRTIRVTNDDEARLYRLVQPDRPIAEGETNTKVSVYVRPRGAHTYDNDVEYGRPGEGVEASISFVIDTALNPNGLLEVGKHRLSGPDNRISIRLDREGVVPDKRGAKDAKNDPTLPQGTLSLDVGSILGDDEWSSTKLGRFVAWGNVLRTRAAGQRTGLNHVREFFTARDGQADFFAAVAERMIADLESRRLSSEEIIEQFSGRNVLASSHQGE